MANTNIRLNQIQADSASSGQFLKFNGVAWLPASTIADDVFTITDNVDSTKQAVFQASGISPATIRTFTFPNANGTLALTSDLLIATGTTGYLPKWTTDGTTLGDSKIFETANTISFGTSVDVPYESRLFVYGGGQGANVDVRGQSGAGTDQAVLDLQPSDFSTTFQSFIFKMRGPTIIGTLVDDIPNANSMSITFAGSNSHNYVIRTFGTPPIRYYINDIETHRITTTGIEVRGGHELRFFDGDNTNSIAIKAPATGSLTANYTLTLPVNDGASGEVLSTNGSGVLSWITASGGGINGSGVTGNLTYWTATGTVDDIAIGTSNQILGVVNAGGSHEYKTISGTSNRVTVTHGTNTITLSAPQDIHTTATPTFGSLSLISISADIAIENTNSSSSLGGGILRIRSNDGSAMANGDRLGSFTFGGWATTALRVGARLDAFASEAWTDTASGGYFSFFTTANGTSSQVEAVRIEQDGDLSLLNNNGVKLFNTANTFSAKIVAPSGLSANYTLTLPNDDGTSNQVLSTNGSGTLSWVSVAASTNLSYTAATRVIASDTGTDATLPLVTSGDAGLAPASGGGTTNFLRADGTWTAVGDVAGPVSAVNNRVVFFDGITGKLIKDSGLTLSGNNTGDQTTIVGITGTKAQFDTALTDGNFMYVGDAPTAHTLDSHSNVTITDNSAGEILKWNGTAWINNTLAEAGIQPAGSYLTGNQTITLSGDITGSGATAITTTIANDAVSYAKLQNVAANSFLANLSGSAVNVQEISTTRIPLFAGAITGTPSSSTYLRGDGAWVVAPVDGNGIYTGSGLITTDTTVSIAATKSFYIEHTNSVTPAFAVEDTGNVSLYSPNSNHILTLTNSGVAITPDLTRQFKFNTTGFEMSDATNTWSVFLLASNSMSADYTLTLPVNDGASGEVLSTNGSGVLSWVSGGGGANLAFTGASSPITLTSDSGTDVIFAQGAGISLTQSAGTMTVAASGITNTELAAGTGGYYKGSGTIAAGAVSTLTASSSLSINYNGGISALLLSDSLSSAILQSKDATQYFYADNTSSLIGSGTSYMEYRDGVLRLWDSDLSQYIGIQPPATGSLTTSYTLTLPSNDGNVDDVLKTDGSGVLSWGSAPAPAPVVIRPSEVTADQNNYAPADLATANIIHLFSNTTMRKITGLSSTGVVDGESKLIHNTGSRLILFTVEDGASTAANRFIGAYNYMLFPGATMNVVYDTTQSRWRFADYYNEGGNKGVYFQVAVGSTTAADWGDLTISNASGSFGTFSATDSLPAAFSCGTGSSSSGLAAVAVSKTVTSAFYVGSVQPIVIEGIVSTDSSLSTVTERYVSFVRFTNTLTGNSTANNQFGLRYSDNLNSGKWQLYVINSSGTLYTADSGVTVATSTTYRLRIETDTNGTTFYAFINGQYCCQLAPGTSPAIDGNVQGGIVKTVGVTQRFFYVSNLKGFQTYP